MAAVLASACCLAPVALTALGLSAAGLSATFEPLRPLFLGVTVLLLGGAVYLAYFRAQACVPGPACDVGPTRERLTRMAVLISALAVVLVALFPLYGGALLRIATPSEATSDGSSAQAIILRIDGMTCEACAASIERRLTDVAGVVSASVSYAEGKAVVATSRKSPPPEAALIEAVKKAGYRAIVADKDAGRGWS